MKFYFLNWVWFSYDFGKVVPSGSTEGYFHPSPIKNVVGLNVFYYFTKINENLKLMKNEKLLSNKVFKYFFIKLLVYNYIKKNLWINCIFMVYITYLIVKAQINYMWLLKNSKWVKFYAWVVFILYVLSIWYNAYTNLWKYSSLMYHDYQLSACAPLPLPIGGVNFFNCLIIHFSFYSTFSFPQHFFTIFWFFFLPNLSSI